MEPKIVTPDEEASLRIIAEELNQKANPDQLRRLDKGIVDKAARKAFKICNYPVDGLSLPVVAKRYRDSLDFAQPLIDENITTVVSSLELVRYHAKKLNESIDSAVESDGFRAAIDYAVWQAKNAPDDEYPNGDSRVTKAVEAAGTKWRTRLTGLTTLAELILERLNAGGINGSKSYYEKIHQFDFSPEEQLHLSILGILSRNDQGDRCLKEIARVVHAWATGEPLWDVKKHWGEAARTRARKEWRERRSANRAARDAFSE